MNVGFRLTALLTGPRYGNATVCKASQYALVRANIQTSFVQEVAHWQSEFKRM